MSQSIPNMPELHSLDTNSFEHLVNSLAIRVLGAGHTGFGPGRDGGRDGYFQGAANYPSKAEKWSGVWYIQSKFHAPHLSSNPQKWLLAQIEKELTAFEEDEDREYPDIWIIATNIDPSGVPETGSFDQAKKIVAAQRPELEKRFHIWGGRKIIDLLVEYPQVAEQYGHFITPGNVLAAFYANLTENKVEVSDIIRYLVIREFETHQYTKLDQAGSQSDARPGVHELFVDLPLRSASHRYEGLVLEDLLKAASRNHRPSKNECIEGWTCWEQHPSRARVWFIFGGPGQGKSTTGQYFSQLQRASLILNWNGDPIKPALKEIASSIKKIASEKGHWLNSTRIPVTIELREYAKWYSDQKTENPRGVLSYLTSRIQKYLQRPVGTPAFKKALREQSWFFAFDGLDEVPTDVKVDISCEIIEFIDDLSYECDCDALFVCTSRPQGYAGQLDQLVSMRGQLIELDKSKALECAKPVIAIGRSPEESEKGFNILASAIESSSVASLMRTPLQSHIMAVVVRDGRRPPERRWALFENFYQVIKSREANRDLPDIRLARLLREENKLLKAIHNRIGFALHAAAERSQGAQTSLSRQQFRDIAETVVDVMKSEEKPEFVSVLEEATETRLVLVNTPDDGESLRYDIRQLQEFFAAEYFYDTVTIVEFRERISIAGADAHWREVMHFLFSAMVELARVSEINEIVILLQSIDSGDGDEDMRDIRRRLAIGASLAARLLQDGVLEQDKRIRTRFEQAFEPLLSSNEFSLLFPLKNIAHPESRNWLCGLARKQLEESTPSESVGAALILLWNLAIDHPASNEILEILRGKPISFRRHVLESSQIIYRGSVLNDFHLKFILEELLAKDWYEGNEIPISALSDHYGFIDSQLKRIGNQLGISDVEIDLIKLILFERSSKKIEETVERIGDIEVVSFQREKLPEVWEGKFERCTELVPASGRGFLSLIVAMVRFNFHQDESKLISLINQIEIDPEKIHKNLPYQIRMYIPEVIFEYIKNGKNGSVPDLLESIKGCSPALRRLRIVRDGDGDALDFESFDRICELGTSMAVSVFFDRDVGENSGWTSQHADRLFLALEKDVSAASRIGVLRWGFIQNFVSSNYSDRALLLLRRALTEFDDEILWRRRIGSAMPFLIDLDVDSKFVYHLLFEVFQIHGLFGRGMRRRLLRGGVDALECRQEIVSSLDGFLSLDDLLIRYNSDISDPIERGTSGIILLLAERHTMSAEKIWEDIFTVLEETREIRFLSVVVGLLGIEDGVPDRGKQVLVSRMLGVFRDSYEHRSIIANILSVWRESSSSPVEKSAPETWAYA